MTARRLGVSAALVDGELLPGDVEVVDGLVTAVGLPPVAGGRIAAPGLVDLQVNGFAGVDLMAADRDGVEHVSRVLASHGVTSWLPTLITADPAHTDRAVGVLGEAVAGWSPGRGARPLGIHLEGPFLHPRRLGTHPPEHRRDPDGELVDRWLAAGPVAAVTLAPELPGALALVEKLVGRGVLVSVGHTDATAEQAHAAFDAGARSVTHLFNAMSPLHHRAPGVPGAALARPDVTLQVILDGHHLAPEVVRLVWAAAPGRVVLVTDAISAAAGTGGDHALAGVRVQVHGGAVRNESGDLAGSALTLDHAVRNACALGLDRASVLTAATATPARLLGRPELGALRPGVPADLVVLEEDLALVSAWVAGRPVEEVAR